MRKAVTSTTWRAKDRRKDDDFPTQQAPQESHQNQPEPSRQPPQHRDRNEQSTPFVSNNVADGAMVAPEQRKLSNMDEASLQAKNYKLAKELVCN